MPSDFDHRKCPNCAGRTMRLTRVEPRRSRRGSAGALSRVSAPRWLTNPNQIVRLSRDFYS